MIGRHRATSSRYWATQATFALLLAICGLTQAADGVDPDAWLSRHPKIRVAIDPDFAPVSSSDGRAQAHGLAPDYLRLIADRVGLRFQFVLQGRTTDIGKTLQLGHVDMLASAFLSAQPQQHAIYTAPYLRLPCVAYATELAALNHLQQLDERRIAVVAAHACNERIARFAPKAQLVELPNAVAALTELDAGKVDAVVGDTVSLHAAARGRGGLAGLTLIGQLGDDTALAFAVRKDWPELAVLLDRALAQISVEDETELRRRWIKEQAAGTAATAPASVDQASSLTEGYAAAIQTVRDQLVQAPSLDPATQKQSLEQLDAAAGDEIAANKAVADWSRMRELATHADSDAAMLEDTSSQDTTPALLTWRANLPERASVEQLEVQLRDERAAYAGARTAAESLQADVARTLDRPQSIRDELTSAKAKLVDAMRALEPVPDGTSPLATAGRLRNLAAARLAQVRVSALEEELRSYESRLRLLTARMRERQHAATEHQQRVDSLQTLILDRSSAVAASLQARLGQEAREAQAGGPAVAAFAKQNQQFGADLARSIDRLAELRTAQDEYALAGRNTAQSLQNTRERLDIGLSEAVGLFLLNERRRLQPLPPLRRTLAAIESELVQTRIGLIDLRERASALSDPARRVAQELQRLPDSDSATRTRQRELLYRLFGTRSEILPQLSVAQTRLADALAATEQELRTLTETSTQLASLLDARLLWIPSHAPVGWSWPAEIGHGLVDFASPARWSESVRLAAGSAASRPLASLGSIAALILLLLFNRKIPASLQSIAQTMRRIRNDHYGLTGRALLLSLAASLWAPLLVWIMARFWQRAADAGHAFSEALALALNALILPAAVLAFIGWLCVDRGLAASHFRWTQSRRQSLQRLRLWLAAAFLPGQFFLAMYFYSSEQVSTAGLARAVFVGSCLLLAWLGWRELADNALWSRRSTAVGPTRSRQWLRIAVVAFCIGVCGLALIGYFLSAVTLTSLVVKSAGVIFLASTAHALALRWLSVGERRLALQRMHEKPDPDNTRDDEDLESRPDFAAVAEQISLASINQQTRRLLRAVSAVFVVAALAWVWSDFIPAFAYLGETAAWHSSYVVDDKQVTVVVTLRSVLLAVLCLALTWIATRNLPGLLEIGMLQRLRVDAPTRYAITAVSRYALTILGCVLGLSLLGLRWGQLQWLVAALTVGLGFGLQEIFANFVSGLIVLFERPMRVGDIITIGGIEGTVTRIRTRATTVVDWDNREVMIPNKTFITEQLTNWTLSDSVTRVVIKVGVAYASDPDQVRALLLDLARAHSKVLREPSPNCWCLALGDNSLEFELRVFVADVLERNPVRNELHAAILRECRARGIAIAFPQLDVWLRQPQSVASVDLNVGPQESA